MLSRRGFIKNAGGLSLTGIAGSSLFGLPEREPKAPRVLRFAHITDVHLDTRDLAVRNFRKVLQTLNAMDDKPDLIIHSGDHVFRSDGKTYEEAELVWNNLAGMLHQYNRIPIRSCIGNHDPWTGPDTQTDESYKHNKLYYKNWVLQVMDMPGRFYSFEKNGWWFIALDSIQPDSRYCLDAEQFSWLGKELERIPANKPVCLFSHVPILSVIPLLRAMKDNSLDAVRYPGSRQHLDAMELKNLFFKHPNIKLCLSGHTHYIDEVDFLGIRYLCGGAVCGNWWKDDHRVSMVFDEFPPAYTIVDLHADGSIRHERIFYPFVE